jgi:hypothetical protein
MCETHRDFEWKGSLYIILCDLPIRSFANLFSVYLNMLDGKGTENAKVECFSSWIPNPDEAQDALRIGDFITNHSLCGWNSLCFIL